MEQLKDKFTIHRVKDRTKKEKAWQPTLKDVQQYIKKHPELLNQETNHYSADKLMMLLDNEKLAALEDQFNEHPNGISIENFVLLMRSAIIHPKEDRYRLVNGLIKLFHDIDINGDKQMEWSEFTQYIIDAVIGEKDMKFFDARFEKDRELTEAEVLDKAYSRKTKRYIMSKTTDNTIHQSAITRLEYSPQSDLLLVLEQGSKKLKFYNEDCSVKLTLEPNFEEKAFIIDACYAHTINMIGCLTSDRYIYMYENNQSSRREVFKQKCDVLQTGIWYLENHKVWIAAGADYALRTYSYGGDTRSAIYDKALLASHVKNITDVAEIVVPKLVATSSLDGLIKLWDLADRYVLAEVKDASTSRGIRGLTYSYDYGGNLLSYGFENHINVWCPEVSTSRPFVGKLEGHSSTIVSCKFVPGSPNCISFDEKGNLRIWDIRAMTTIQVISFDQNTNILVNDISVMTKHEKIVLGGKRLTFFDNTATTKTFKNSNDDIYPIHAEYNEYFHTFAILTKIDLRIYDAQTGKLRKVFTEINDEKSSSELSCMCFGARQRKFYLGDNAGSIRSYNMKNSEYLKTLTNPDEEEAYENQRQATQRMYNHKLALTNTTDKSRHKKDYSPEPEERVKESRRERRKPKTVKEYIRDRDYTKKKEESPDPIEDKQNKQQMSYKADQSTSALNDKAKKRKENVEISQLIYSTEEKLLISSSWDSTIRIYDESDTQETMLLRIMAGGHCDSDISALDYSSYLSLIASGSGNGVVAVWDFDSGRLESTCVGHNADITSVKFCKEYPLLVSSSADSTICLWGVRPCRVKYRYICIARLYNSIWNEEGEEKRQMINSILINTKPSEGIAREAIGSEYPIGSEYKKYVGSTQFQNLSKVNSDEKAKKGKMQAQFASPVDNRKVAPRKIEDYITTEDNCPEWVEFFERPEDFERYKNTYDEELKITKKRLNIYLGDQKGGISIANFDSMAQERQIEPLNEQWNSEKRAESYQFKRKDHIDVSKTVENQLRNEKMHRTPFTAHLYNSVLIKRWYAHQAGITSLVHVEEPSCLISCGIDKHVKIWTLEGDILGDINLGRLGNRLWNFPYDWMHAKLQELEEAFKVLKKVERAEMESLTEDAKDKIRANYLLGQFGSEKDMINKLAQESSKETAGMFNVTRNLVAPSQESTNQITALEARVQTLLSSAPWEKSSTQAYGTLGSYGSMQEGNIETQLPKKATAIDYAEKTLNLLGDLEKIDTKHKKELNLGPQKSLTKRLLASDGGKSVSSKLNSRGMSRASMDTLPLGSNTRGPSPNRRLRDSGFSNAVEGVMRKTAALAPIKNSTALRDFAASQTNLQLPTSEKIEDSHSERRTDKDAVNDYEKSLQSPKFAERKLFHNFSSGTFKKNQRYTSHLAKSYSKSRPPRESSSDVKFNMGESSRMLRMATRSHIDKFEAESQNIYGTENEPLVMRNEFYKSLRGKGLTTSSKNREQTSNQATQREPGSDYKIVGNRLFMEDVTKNKPKIVQSTGKLYVINQ